MPRNNTIMATSGQSERAAVNRRKALKLRCVGTTYENIGRRLGVHKTTAIRYVQQGMSKLAKLESAEAANLRAMEGERLDLALRDVVKVLRTTADDDVKLRAAMALMRLSESRRRLLGIDSQPGLDDAAAVGININFAPMPEAGPEIVAGVPLIELTGNLPASVSTHEN